MSRSKKTQIAAVALPVVAVAVALGVAELLLALFHPVDFRLPPQPEDDWKSALHQPSDLPGLGYELAPGHVVEHWGMAVRTNGSGMRGPEVTAPEGGGVRRIAVIGDSITFGFGVDARETYAAQLERLIERRRRAGEMPTEVLNFGVGGYSTRDEAIVLRHRVLAFDPELVIIGYALNDPETRPIQPLHSRFAEPRWWQHFHLFRLVARYDHTRRIERHGGGDYVRSLYAEENGLWPGVLDAFAEIAQTTGAEGIPVLLVIFPDLKHWSADAYERGDLHAKVAGAAREAGFAVLDIADVFRGLDARRLHLPRDILHPSPFGHGLAARAIYGRLVEEPSLFFAGR